MTKTKTEEEQVNLELKRKNKAELERIKDKTKVTPQRIETILNNPDLPAEELSRKLKNLNPALIKLIRKVEAKSLLGRQDGK